MLIGSLAGIALAVGAPPVAVALYTLAAARPGWFMAVVAGWVALGGWRRRSRTTADAEARFLEGVSAELQGGASLRGAIVAAAGAVPELALQGAARLGAAGLPMGMVADELRVALPINGRLTGSALLLAAQTGGRAADVFGRLAAQAADAGDLVRERMALTAQARLSAVVVGVAPVIVAVAVALARGGLPEGSPLAGALVAIGLALEGAGGVTVWLMVRAAQR